MLVNLYNQHWHRAEITVGLVAGILFIIGLSLAEPIVQNIESPLLAVLLLGVPGGVVTAGLVWWYQQSKNRLVKVFYVRHDLGVRIVGNVLTQKRLPFKRIAPTNPRSAARVVFALEQDDLVIQVDLHLYRGTSGTAVRLGPVTKYNRPLVQSLQEKIDDAFLPQGLSR
jgi:hypothetical protein